MADGSREAGIPSSNRGCSEFRNADGTLTVVIDWFSASVDLFAVLREVGYLDRDDAEEVRQWMEADAANARVIALHVFTFFFAGLGMELDTQAGPGRFYAWRVRVLDRDGKHVGLIELGGDNCRRADGTYTARVELTGTGCAMVSAARCGHAKRWLELQAKLESCAGRLTRCDIAADDLIGAYPIRLAQTWYASGDFDNRGQRPKAQLIDDYDSGDGKTLYVGSKKAEKQLRVYEKGREQGDKESPWVRYEGQFRASVRKELPLDMLRDPAGYLLGAYPVLRFLRCVATRIEITKAAIDATWKSARRNVKRQYGATLNFIVRQCKTPEALFAVINTCTSNKLPAWATQEAADHWPEIAGVNRTIEGVTP
ncbi:replication initiation factor domain-containing protein [Xanthomonas phaseoli pv. phaseoli]|uniref:replication initiation factor domain-containing protein n=1 Tax=Xanthomonas phaseoli TaxID=1985254 RepID=UPI0005372345|nr:replication initiation factor domain-containing protein [Xanthomonas phaseoli]KGT50282.1 replication protein [Xanthomonas phaseoli pv. phaseoli]KHS32421.1 replication protein [Xanthomonas phaseoli pv. phaseoli]MBO9737348.1 replication initiation factor domain-containing protein [Xanthomonas phaseoli pv. phaseoli]UZB14187.1 replication initiation factor domain-containing protein [Xanthomonas phaseoli pv. phaseoli]UZB23021.1 replication initiation factor domain-containing protein [Xanthomonas